MRTRIIVVDDHQIVRQCLKTLIEMEPDMQVVAEAEDGRMALTLVREFIPHVVVMDVNMSVMDGVTATRQILSEFTDIKVIGLSMYGDRHFVTNMLKAGAHGYLVKDCAFEELAQAIRLVMSNRIYLSPGITDTIVQDYNNLNFRFSNPVSSPLSDWEQGVVQLMVEGKPAQQIAEVLELSVSTVNNHRQKIMRKLGIRSVAELTKYAIRNGLASPEA